jgi:hypothetical protein
MTKRKVGALEIDIDLALSGKLVCPNCGDSKFGSTDQGDGHLIRSCHGYENDETACTFRWPSEDDHKYFYISAKVLHEKGII